MTEDEMAGWHTVERLSAELDAEVQVCSGDGGELLDLMLETE